MKLQVTVTRGHELLLQSVTILPINVLRWGKVAGLFPAAPVVFTVCAVLSVCSDPKQFQMKNYVGGRADTDRNVTGRKWK